MIEAPVLEAPLADSPRDGQQPPLRLMVLVDKRTGISPGQRYRLEQWGRVTRERHDIELDFFPFESPELTRIIYQPGHKLRKGLLMMRAFLRRRADIRRAADYDGVIIYRWAALIGPPVYEKQLFKLGVPTFFDFDDALWQEGGTAQSINGRFAALKFAGKTPSTIAGVSAVTAGNEYLADWARQRNDNVHILPTTIDLASYPLIPEPAADDPLVICWTGSNTTLAHFEHARGALELVAARRRLVVKVICDRPPANPITGAETVFIPWQEEGEAQTVGDCHIGIMPLPDDHYTRGKCGLKALQYMATGRPVVISPVGMNCDLVQHGDNGFLARQEDEWVELIERLADAPELRARIGAAARRTVEQGYSAEVVAAKFAQVVRETVARGARGGGAR
jgi:glycosyltransferase involved in cell wall biosynthesis